VKAFARSPAIDTGGVFGQGLRFALSGVIVALVYLLTTTLLALVLSLPFQVALPIGFCLAIGVHFTLQRYFVWGHGEHFALTFRRQAGRYLVLAGTQYAVTAASTSLLPSALGLSTEAVYLITVLFVSVINFMVFRNGIFHPERSLPG
jgi:putative flippase GtrA